MGVIEVGGVQGVGKSHLIAMATQHSGRTIAVWKRSHMIADLLGVRVEDLWMHPRGSFELARARMRELTISIADGVFDSHFTEIPDTGRSFTSIASHIRLAVLVVASPETVRLRRAASTRPRRALDLTVIESQLNIEQAGAEFFAHTARVPLVVLRNEDTDRAAPRLADLFEEYI